ncbi:MAG: indole-3-glycerol phosphate synthase TrpC [Trueperaceae bacterium]|nr:indole-3-glycerol phosphate synthase TrpC [Trueperaceae bacterium]
MERGGRPAWLPHLLTVGRTVRLTVQTTSTCPLSTCPHRWATPRWRGYRACWAGSRPSARGTTPRSTCRRAFLSLRPARRARPTRSARPRQPPAGRDRLAAALRAPGLSLITEIKRGSPSQGSIADLEPVEAALAYQAGGAAALSVLTEPRHFGGRLSHLRDVAAASSLPAMRKEFVVHPAQLTEAAEAGAAAALLIAAVLGPRLGAYLDYAHALGLDALVEVHDEAELEAALAAGAEIVGVNNRDLRTLEVDLATAPRLLRRARDAGFAGVLVAESGYAGADDLANVADLADAALIGTALAGSGDLARAVRTLLADLAARTASAPAQPGRRPS